MSGRPRGSTWWSPRARSSLWRRLEDAPRSVDIASQLLPTRNWIEVLDSLSTGNGPVPLRHVALLLGWTVAFGALAWLGYRRDEGERFA